MSVILGRERRNFLFLLAGVALVYLGCLRNAFLWDDQVVLVANSFIKNWKNIGHLFSSSYFTGSGELSYRPVATLSYMVGHGLWGLSESGFHGFSLGLHLIAGFAVYSLLREIFNENAPAFWGAALFLLHPVNSEAVLEASFNEEILCTAFFVTAFHLFVRRDKTKAKWKTYSLSLTCYFLALFSKEMAIVLPLLLLLYDTLLNKEKISLLHPARWTIHAGYWMVSLFYLWVRFWVLRNPKEIQVGYIQDSFWVNALTMFKVFFLYLKQLIWPSHLSPDHFVEISTKLNDPRVMLSLAGGAGLAAVWVLFLKRSRLLAFFMAWTVVGLLPVMNLVPFLKDNLMADRYLYLPSIGFCAFMSQGLTEIGPWKQRAKPFLMVLLLGYGFLTFRRVGEWRNAVQFWGRAVVTDPQSIESHNRLGAAYSQRGEFEKATEEYLKALRLNPKSTRALNNLGNVYFSTGRYDRAIQMYDQSLAIDPHFAVTYSNRGSAHKMAGQGEQAISDYLRAVELNPAFAEVYLNLAMTYEDLHQPENMKKAYATYLALRKK